MPRLLDIITNPNPLLRKRSNEISPEDIKGKAFQALCADMKLTMVKKDGVGLAAPQIGKNVRLIVVNTDGVPKCLINPELTKLSWAKEWGEEGCLSVPDTFGQVRRHKKLSYRYIDINGQETKDTASGMMARILQHEVDHLDGVLFIDKARGVKKIK